MWRRAGRVVLRWLIGVGLTLLATGATVLALELLIRIVPDLLPDGSLAALQGPAAERLPDRLVYAPNVRMVRFSQLQPDAELGYRYLSNSRITILHPDYGKVDIDLDERGFRNRSPDLYQAADIVVLGDSYTLAMTAAYEESWPRLLETEIGVRVLNLAVASYDFYQYEKLLPRFAAETRPHWVIVGVFQNDFWCIHEAVADFFKEHPAASYGDYRWSTQSLPPAERFRLARAVKRAVIAFVDQRSYLLAMARHAVAVHEKPHLIAFAQRPAATMRVNLTLLLGYPNRDQLADSCAGRLARRALASIKTWVSRRGARLLVVYIPQKEEVYLPWLVEEPALFTGTIAPSDLADGTANASVYAGHLAALSRELGFEFIDMTGHFRAHRDGPVYFPLDGHANATGQRIMASVVARFLQAARGPGGAVLTSSKEKT